MITRPLLLFLALLICSAVPGVAGTVINTNLPTGTSIVNINAQQDGTASYDGYQNLFYSPFSTQGSAALLTLPVKAGTYSFTIVDPADALARFPGLTREQSDTIYTAWTYNSPWVTDYMVFDVSAVADSSVPQLFDGAPESMSFGDAASAYAAAVAGGYAGKIRVGPLGRASTTLVTTFTFATDTTLVFAVPDAGLYDNAGGVSVVVAPAQAPPTIALTSPPADVTLVEGANLPLAASVTDPAGIASTVQFYVDGLPVGAAITTAPYVLDATAAVVGPHTLSAVVTDNQGRQNTSTETFSIAAANPAAPAPTAALLTPLANRNLLAGSTLTLTFAASAAEATSLASVSLYADGVLLAAFDGDGNPIHLDGAPGGQPIRRDAVATPAGTVFQTSYTLPAAEALVNLIAVALDQLGQATISKLATVHATVTADRPPLLAFEGLANGATVAVGSTTALTIDASDPDAGGTGAATPGRPVPRDASVSGTIAELEYWIGQVSQPLGALPPYTVDFQPPTAGKYVLHAVATDGSGLATISAPVVVTATPALPVVTVLPAAAGEAIEGSTTGKVLVLRTGDTSAPLTVFYKVKGSAVAGVDYQPVTGSVTFGAGVAKAKVKIHPIDNQTVDGTRVAKLKLLPAPDGSYLLGSVTKAKILVIDND